MIFRSERNNLVTPLYEFRISLKHEKRGDTLFANLKFEDAVLCYYDSVVCAPENFRAHIKLLKVFHILEDIENLILGLEYFDVVAAVVDDISLLLTLVELNNRTGRDNEAERILRMVKRITGKESHNLLDAIATKTQDISSADRSYYKALQFTSSAGDVQEYMLLFMLRMGNINIVEKRVRAILLKEPQKIKRWQLLDEILKIHAGKGKNDFNFFRHFQNRERVLPEAREIIEGEQECVTARYILLENALESREYNEANKHIKAILQLDPRNKYAISKLQQIRRNRGEATLLQT